MGRPSGERHFRMGHVAPSTRSEPLRAPMLASLNPPSHVRIGLDDEHELSRNLQGIPLAPCTLGPIPAERAQVGAYPQVSRWPSPIGPFGPIARRWQVTTWLLTRRGQEPNHSEIASIGWSVQRSHQRTACQRSHQRQMAKIPSGRSLSRGSLTPGRQRPPQVPSPQATGPSAWTPSALDPAAIRFLVSCLGLTWFGLTSSALGSVSVSTPSLWT